MASFGRGLKYSVQMQRLAIFGKVWLIITDLTNSALAWHINSNHCSFSYGYILVDITHILIEIH